MSNSGATTLGNIVNKVAMLEVVCSRCERRGRLTVAKLIEQHGEDAQLTNLRTVLAGKCPRIGRAIYGNAASTIRSLVRLWRGC